MLKDGKTYPSICVTNEFLPRIFSTRDINKKYGTYYGPYSYQPTMKALLDVIYKIYHIRGCKKLFTEEGINKKKYDRCIQYDMHKCLGPCIGIPITTEAI